ncbi:PREDICTED: U-box domain-containing protein 15-like [Ipomoea nil]|uniref:U-box domain-containing protein 15-like n=1 Tax=Ipomoea nil TaxID=35883 RepID=UPI000901E7B2|nr:PREDICTED: U-box domain-containing protein 15-like [Ipomoea nil]
MELPGARKMQLQLCITYLYLMNKYRIVQAGAVKYLIELMRPDVGMVDEAFRICREGGVPILVEILELGSSRAKEDAAVALLQLCTDNMQCCNMVLRLGAVSPLTALSNCSTPRARQLAQRLLNYLREKPLLGSHPQLRQEGNPLSYVRFQSFSKSLSNPMLKSFTATLFPVGPVFTSRGTFEQGLGPTVMVKVLDLLKNGASMSFHSECEILRNIRHRNLVVE